MFFVLFLYFLLSSTFVIGKVSLLYAQPVFLIGVRMLLGGSALLAYLYVRDRKELHLKKRDWLLFAQIVLFHIYISFILEFWAYRYVTAAKTAFMYNLTPFITALLAYFIFHERLNRTKWIGMIIAFLGTLPVLLAETPKELSIGSFFFLSVPEIGLLVSMASGAYGWIVMKRLVVERHYSPIFINGIGMFFGGFAALMTSFAFEGKPLLKCPSQAGISSVAESIQPAQWFCFYGPYFFKFMLCVISLILLANVIFYNYYGVLLKKYSATFLSLVGLLCPLFTAVIGWLFIGEVVTWQFFVSLVLVLFGAYIFYQDELKEEQLI